MARWLKAALTLLPLKAAAASGSAGECSMDNNADGLRAWSVGHCHNCDGVLSLRHSFVVIQGGFKVCSDCEAMAKAWCERWPIRSREVCDG